MILSKVHVWLILCWIVLISVGATHFCYYPDPAAIKNGIGAVVLAVLLPLVTFFYQWMKKKYPWVSKQWLSSIPLKKELTR